MSRKEIEPGKDGKSRGTNAARSGQYAAMVPARPGTQIVVIGGSDKPPEVEKKKSDLVEISDRFFEKLDNRKDIQEVLRRLAK